MNWKIQHKMRNILSIKSPLVIKKKIMRKLLKLQLPLFASGLFGLVEWGLGR